MPILKTLLKEKNFTSFYNSLLQNEILTYEAKGLLVELISRPADWRIYKSQLTREHTKETKINRIFKELKQAGYLYIHTERDNKTKQIVDRFWIVSDEPLTKEQFQKSIENLNSGKPYVKETLIKANQDLQNKDSLQNKELTNKRNNNIIVDENKKTFSSTLYFLFNKYFDQINGNIDLLMNSEYDSIQDIIIKHFCYYQYMFNKKHPSMKNEQMENVLEILEELFEVMGEKLFDEHIQYWQRNDIETDYNLNHFVKFVEGCPGLLNRE